MNTHTSKVLLDIPIETPLALGNRAMRACDYGTAIDYYLKALEERPGLGRMIEGNLELAQKWSLNKSQNRSFELQTLNNFKSLTNAKPNHNKIHEVINIEIGNDWSSPFFNWRNIRSLKKQRFDISLSEEISLKNFGASFLGPVLSSFFLKLSKYIESANELPTLNFLAREGYFLELVFKKMAENKLIKPVVSNYLFCSRTLLFKISLAKPVLWTKLLNHYYKGKLADFFKDRFAFTPEEIAKITIQSFTLRNSPNQEISLPENKELVLSILTEAKSVIKDITKPKLDLYLRYLKEIGFGSQKNEYVVDLGYAGTIQTLLSDITGVSTIGHYFITTKKATNTKLCKFNGHLLNNINFNGGHPLLDRSLFLESLLTAPHGSVTDICLINKQISFSFGAITTAQLRFSELEIILEGAIDYVLMVNKIKAVLDINELSEYYGRFITKADHFPTQIWDLFEIDDTISGGGIINPLFFFNKN